MSDHKSLKNKKLNKFQFAFLMFNYVVGFGFISTVGEIIELKGYGLVAFFGVSLISLGVLIVFSKLAEKYQYIEGSSYGFAKQTHGKSFTFFQGWNQFIQGPILSASTPLFLQGILSSQWPELNRLWQGISISLFLIFIIASTLQINKSFKIISFFALFKWIILALGLILIIQQAITKNLFISSFMSSDKITIAAISSSMLSFVYAYGGIEGITTITKETSKGNIRKTYFYVFGTIVLTYLIFYLCLLGAIKINDDDIQIIKSIFNVTLGTTGIIIFSIGTISNKASSITSSSIVNARNLGPMAEDGYFPKFLSKKNDNGVYVNATYFSALLSIISMVIFEILPEFLDLGDVFINVIQVGTISFLIQYLMTGITSLFLERKGFIKYKVWEKILILLMFIVISFILLTQLIPPIIGQEWENKNLVIIISYPIWLLIGFIIWWINLYIKKRNKKSITK